MQTLQNASDLLGVVWKEIGHNFRYVLRSMVDARLGSFLSSGRILRIDVG
jgi:hypothetical protein